MKDPPLWRPDEDPILQYLKRPQLLIVPEVAFLFHRDEKTVYKHIQAGTIPHQKIGPKLIRVVPFSLLPLVGMSEYGWCDGCVERSRKWEEFKKSLKGE